MRTCKKTIFLLTLIVTMFAMIAAAAGAQTYKLSYSYPVSGSEVRLYKIADIANGDIVFDDAFARYSVNFDDSSAASTLASYIIRDSVEPLASAQTDSTLKTTFDVENGVYLILGNTVISGASRYTALPVLISVAGEDVEVNGKYEEKKSSGSDIQDSADVDNEGTDSSSTENTDKTTRSGSSTSTQEGRSRSGSSSSITKKNITDDKTETNRISAAKVWRGGKRADSITVQLLKDGEVYDEQVLDVDNNWRCSWADLDENSEWLVVEKEVTDGYTVSTDHSGSTWVITNTADDWTEDTDDKDNNETDSSSNSDTTSDDDSRSEIITDSEEDSSNIDSSDNGSSDSDSTSHSSSNSTSSSSSNGGSSSSQTNSNGGGSSSSGLPQTGQPWMPVFGFAFAGVIALMIGEYRKTNRQ